MTQSRDQLEALGFASLGDDVRIHPSVIFFGAERIRIGSRVRIDCFSVLSAGPEGIVIGNNVHVAAGCYLFGSGGPITLDDFSGLSSRVALYTATDDYLGGALTNPTVPDAFKQVARGPVTLGRHAIVGAGAVVLPNVALGFGAAVGALAVVRKGVAECDIVYGNPTQRLPRKRDGDRLRRLEAEYLASLEQR